MNVVACIVIVHVEICVCLYACMFVLEIKYIHVRDSMSVTDAFRNVISSGTGYSRTRKDRDM